MAHPAVSRIRRRDDDDGPSSRGAAHATSNSPAATVSAVRTQRHVVMSADATVALIQTYPIQLQFTWGAAGISWQFATDSGLILRLQPANQTTSIDGNQLPGQIAITNVTLMCKVNQEWHTLPLECIWNGVHGLPGTDGVCVEFISDPDGDQHYWYRMVVEGWG